MWLADTVWPAHSCAQTRNRLAAVAGPGPAPSVMLRVVRKLHCRHIALPSVSGPVELAMRASYDWSHVNLTQVDETRYLILDEVHCMNERGGGDVWERLMLGVRLVRAWCDV